MCIFYKIIENLEAEIDLCPKWFYLQSLISVAKWLSRVSALKKKNLLESTVLSNLVKFVRFPEKFPFCTDPSLPLCYRNIVSKVVVEVLFFPFCLCLNQQFYQSWPRFWSVLKKFDFFAYPTLPLQIFYKYLLITTVNPVLPTTTTEGRTYVFDYG